MSQKTELRLNALEGRVTALEKRLQETEDHIELSKKEATRAGRLAWEAKKGLEGKPLTDYQASIESRIGNLEDQNPPEEGFKAVHRGRGRWQVVGVNGETLTDRYYSKEEAEDLAEQMNHETLELSA